MANANGEQVPGQHRHIDDDGTLSFFIDQEGNFGIICDRGHGWYGKWKDALTFFTPDPSAGKAFTLIDQQAATDAPEWMADTIQQQYSGE